VCLVFLVGTVIFKIISIYWCLVAYYGGIDGYLFSTRYCILIIENVVSYSFLIDGIFFSQCSKSMASITRKLSSIEYRGPANRILN